MLLCGSFLVIVTFKTRVIGYENLNFYNIIHAHTKLHMLVEIVSKHTKSH